MKKTQKLLTVILFLGSIFAWYTVVNDFLRFYKIYNTIFRIQNCVVPNPVITPCFYGAIAFIIALIWSIFIIKDIREDKTARNRHMLWFLICCNIFGWSNFILQLVRWLKAGSKPIIGCSGQIMINPFTTPCFIGSGFFFLSLILSLYIVTKFKKCGFGLRDIKL